MSFDPVNLSALSTRKQLANVTAKSIADQMQNVWDFMQEEMAKSQEVQAAVANWRHKESPKYKIGDMVWLSTKNMKTEKLSKKLDHKMIGPYQIKALVKSSY